MVTTRPESRWRRALLVGSVLLVGSLVPSPFERNPKFERVGPDKALHFIGHGGFAVALAEALAANGHPRGAVACVAATLSATLGACIGVLQRPVPGREPERADFFAGTLGAIVAAGYWLFDGRETSVVRR
jgi:VanZ family protein